MHTMTSYPVGPMMALIGGALVALLARGQGNELRSFDRVLLLESTSETSASVSIGDVDANGTLDVVLAKGRHWPLNNLILRNDGKGHFTTENLADAPDRTYSAAVAADINGDGIPDLVVGDEQNGVFLYAGAGRRTFESPPTLGTGTGAPYSIGVADLNRDGKTDIVVGRQEAPGTIFFNQGGNRPTFSVASWNDGKGSVYGVAIADLDGDGWPDIAAARSEAPNGIWFSGPVSTPKKGGFPPAPRLPASFRPKTGSNLF
jgi:hypothetical protein